MTSGNDFSRTDLPLVSVVTPAFDAMPYIRETVESVRAQDYPRIEHIIMDGGSSDGTVQYLEGQQGLRWVSEPDRGQSHALNKAFSRASGEIVGWLNADDIYEHGAVKKAVGALLEDDEIDVVYGDLRIIDENSNPIGYSRSGTFDIERLLISNFIKQPTVFMRRRVLNAFAGVNESLHYTMDREFWLRMACGGMNIVYLEGAILADFRLCPGTKTYEDTPEFRLEWEKVLKDLSESSGVNTSLRESARVAAKKTRGQYHVVEMIRAMEGPDRWAVLVEFTRAIRHDAALLLNRGTWKFLAMGLLGIRADRYRRFRKSA